MDARVLLVCAVCLSLERICYVVISRAPHAFRACCARSWVGRLGEPIDVVRWLFVTFKAVQGAVFFGWCFLHGGGSLLPLDAPPWASGLGLTLIGAGQLLSTSVFYRLGPAGVFYGSQLGHSVPWCHGFPFAYLTHPQYVGTVLSIWGLFLVARFPHPDWYALPVLETVYYWVGARLEEGGLFEARRNRKNQHGDTEKRRQPAG